MTQPFQVTPIYDLLLRGSPQTPAGLYQLHLLTAEQLTRLHYSAGSIKAVKARLKTLVDHGLVQAEVVPSRQFRTPYYYTLGRAGMRYLARIGYETQRVPEEAAHALFVAHTLELNDVLISALLLHRDVPSVRLVSLVHERTLKRQPYHAGTGAGTFTLIPDAFLDFWVGDTLHMPVLLEHDRGTEEQRYFRRRVRAYAHFLKSGAYEQVVGDKAVTIAFTTFAGAERAQQMARWTRAELGGEPRALIDLFRFGALTRPVAHWQVWLEPAWVNPYETQRFLLRREEGVA